jgi:hypothetical protein
VFAAFGYAITFCACLLGIPVVLIALGLVIAVDLGRGLLTGTFQERLRKPRW